MNTNENLCGKEYFGYTLESIIGEGSCGRVYNAVKHDANNHSYHCAIKHIVFPSLSQYNKILSAMGNDIQATDQYFAEMLEQFYREIDIMYTLSGQNNKNIVTYYDHDVQKRASAHQYDIFIRMEMLIPLSKFITMNGLNTQTAVKIGKDMLCALKIAHDNNIMHRDIKEDNIFVSDTGDFKLGDFGISKTFKTEESSKTKTGTPIYMAPEMIRGENYNNTVDLYALGIILYRFFNNNRIPFLPEYPVAFSAADIENSIAKRTAFDPIPAPTCAPNEIATVILKAIQPQENRFFDTTEFLNALTQAEAVLTKEQLAQILQNPTANIHTQNNKFKTEGAKTLPLPQNGYYTAPYPNSQANPQFQGQPYPGQQYQNQPYQSPQYQGQHYQNPVYPNGQNPNLYPNKTQKKKNGVNIGLIVAVSILATLLILGGCYIGIVRPMLAKSEQNADFSLDEKEITITTDESYSIHTNAEDTSKLDYASNDTAIATVDENGTVYAVSEGETVIKVFNEKYKHNLTVTVKAKKEEPGLNPDTDPQKPKADKIDVAQISSILASDVNGASFGVYVMDIKNHKNYLMDNSKTSMGASALVTLPILYTMGMEIENDMLSPTEPIPFTYSYNGRGIYKQADDGRNIEAREMLASMLKYSDNNCMNSLIDYMSLSEIQECMRKNAMTGTSVVKKLEYGYTGDYENMISAYDAGKMLYQMISNKKFPGKEFMLKNFQISDSVARYGMGQSIPAGITFLNHNAVTDKKYNEIIYVESDRTEFIAVFLSNNGKSQNSANISAQVASYIYNALSN